MLVQTKGGSVLSVIITVVSATRHQDPESTPTSNVFQFSIYVWVGGEKLQRQQLLPRYVHSHFLEVGCDSCNNDPVAVAMPSAMKDGQICFSRGKWLASFP